VEANELEHVSFATVEAVLIAKLGCYGYIYEKRSLVLVLFLVEHGARFLQWQIRLESLVAKNAARAQWCLHSDALGTMDKPVQVRCFWATTLAYSR